MKTVSKISITAFLALSMLAVASAADSVADAGKGLPSSHMIANVPWHQQMNGLFCGEGVLEGVYDYWGPDIDQKQIANVASTS